MMTENTLNTAYYTIRFVSHIFRWSFNS